MKESLNHRDLYGLDTLTSSRFVYIFYQLFVYTVKYLFTLIPRFLTSLLSMLTTHMNGQELGWILGKQLLSSLQTLFRLIGPELNLITSLRGCRIKATTNGGVVAASNVCAIFEDTLQRCKSLPPPLKGVELARMMRVGTRVVRGNFTKNLLFTLFLMDFFRENDTQYSYFHKKKYINELMQCFFIF